MEKVGETYRFVLERDEGAARLILKRGERHFGYATLHVVLVVAVIGIGLVPLWTGELSGGLLGALTIGGCLLSIGGLFHTVDGRARAGSAHPWLRRAAIVTRARGAGYRGTVEPGAEVDGRRLSAEGARVIVTCQTVVMQSRYGSRKHEFFEVHLAFEARVFQLLRTRDQRAARALGEDVAALFGWPPPGEVVGYEPLSVRSTFGTTFLVSLAESVLLIAVVIGFGLARSPLLWLVGALSFVAGHLGIHELARRALRGAADDRAQRMLAIAARARAAPAPTKKTAKRRAT